MTFADQLKAHRKRTGISQTDCAELLEISRRALVTWENGTVVPPGITQEGAIARLAKKPDAIRSK